MSVALPRMGTLFAALLLALAGAAGLLLGLPPSDAREGIDGLDPGFGDDGLVVTHLGGGDRARAMAVQPDGRIVLAGDSYAAGDERIALARYLPEGGLDPSFGEGGIALVVYDGNTAELYAVALQPDGMILVAGHVRARGLGPAQVLVARYDAAGALDRTFGDAGLVFLAAGESAVAKDLAVQPDGRILVVGSVDRDALLLRLRPDGRLDESFGDQGVSPVDFGGSDEGRAIALQEDGRILIAGMMHDWDADHTRFAAARLGDDRRLDRSFAQDGISLTQVGPYDWQRAVDVALQSDGKILLAGESQPDRGDPPSAADDGVVLRLDTDGRVDPSFGEGGIARIDMGSASDHMAAMLVDEQDRILVGMRTALDYEGRHILEVGLFRLAPDGRPDLDFGVLGREVAGSGRHLLTSAIALQDDGGILVAATKESAPGPDTTYSDFALLRFVESERRRALFLPSLRR